jgi:YegS/Rv2252/BmrU family lipid kinase
MTPPAQSTIRRALIIYNPASGRRKGRRQREIELARVELRNAGIHTELAATDCAGDAVNLARQAQGATDMVIACGGDGTINEVVNGLALSRIPMAILPAGTANILAKELGIPWNIPAAARLVPHARYRRIAIGAIDYLAPKGGAGGDSPGVRYFVCVAGAGPDGALVRAVPHHVKHHTGQGAYWLEGLRQLVMYRFPAFHVDDGTGASEARLLVIGRTKHYGGPFRITTEASLFEDSFELMAANSRNPLRYLAWLPRLYFERLRGDSRIRFWKAKEFTCIAANGAAVYAQADGEPIGGLPLRFRVVPDALTICVPATTEIS